MRALIATVFLVLAAGVSAQDNMAKNQVAKEFKGKVSQEIEAGYLLFLPKDYEKDRAKKWPLILFLHGAGERGTNLNRVAVHGPPKIVRDRPDFPFIVVSPQCPTGRTWSNETLIGLLDSVMKEQRVDESRVYLTGLSMGGYGTWSLGLRHADRFAAIAPICGGGDILPILLPDSRRQAALKQLPVWAFHGAKDPVVPLVESERMVDALKRIGSQNVKLTVYPEAGHDSWTEAYNDPELYDWFMKHTRSRTVK